MVGLAVAAIAAGHLVTVTEPRTTSALCARVAFIGDGAGGIPTVWAVQLGGSRTLKLPLDEVRPGCSPASSPPSGAPAADKQESAPGHPRPAAGKPPGSVPVSKQAR